MLAAFMLQKFLANFSFLIAETRVALFTDEPKLFPRFCIWMVSHSGLAISQRAINVLVSTF